VFMRGGLVNLSGNRLGAIREGQAMHGVLRELVAPGVSDRLQSDDLMCGWRQAGFDGPSQFRDR